MVTLVVFTTRMIVLRPREGESTRVWQGSTLLSLLTGAPVGVSVTSRVGSVTGVSVGRGVSVGVSVGGMGVAVGMAAWVCATMVKAAATAVFWISTGLTVGTGSAPQAPSSSARRMIGIEKRIMGGECLLRI